MNHKSIWILGVLTIVIIVLASFIVIVVMGDRKAAAPKATYMTTGWVG